MVPGQDHEKDIEVDLGHVIEEGTGEMGRETEGNLSEIEGNLSEIDEIPNATEENLSGTEEMIETGEILSEIEENWNETEENLSEIEEMTDDSKGQGNELLLTTSNLCMVLLVCPLLYLATNSGRLLWCHVGVSPSIHPSDVRQYFHFQTITRKYLDFHQTWYVH